MLVPFSWLKEYVDIPVTPDELEKKLFDIGFEVEEKHEVGEAISHVVVGLVTKCGPIPETHLHRCEVDAGEHGVLPICCGADNVTVGKKFPLALVGATVIKTGKDHKTVEGIATIAAGKLRGYDSFGMLCSGTELGLTEDLYEGAGYNGLLVLPDDAPVGADVKPIVGLDDIIFDVSITANRPDCLSIFGLAREVAAVLNTTLHEPDISYTAKPITKDGFKVTVEAPDLCPRYIGHYVANVKIGPSPLWMRRRLALVGINAISNIVDITNYVLKELGQPMHAFDADFLQGNEIRVRRAKNGEKIVTLDEKEFALTDKNLVICDGDRPVALAGIMGGLNSEIRDTTTGVIFESAKFARDNIRKSSRALGQASDSSAVFAKGVQEYTTVMASRRSLHLIEELGCGDVSETRAEFAVNPDLDPIPMTASIARVNGVLGITVPTGAIVDILTRLHFEPKADGDTLTIQIPRYREDMESYPDIAEEVIRMYGYDHVKPTFMPTAAVTAGGRNERQNLLLSLKRTLAAAGAYECIHYSFISPSDFDRLHLPEDAWERQAITLINPINIDLSVMRTFLAPEMIAAMARNQKRNIPDGDLFEIGNVFLAKSLPLTDYPEEVPHVCVGVFGEKKTFYDAKRYAETVADFFTIDFTYQPAAKPYLHPYQSADICWNGETVGYIGAVRENVKNEYDMRVPSFVVEISLGKLAPCFARKQTYVPLPKFDIEKRDFAFVADAAVPCDTIEHTIAEASAYVTDVELFDIYEGAQVGEGKKSMAFTVTFTPKEEAFTDAAIEAEVAKILNALKTKAGATLRE